MPNFSDSRRVAGRALKTSFLILAFAAWSSDATAQPAPPTPPPPAPQPGPGETAQKPPAGQPAAGPSAPQQGPSGAQPTQGPAAPPASGQDAPKADGASLGAPLDVPQPPPAPLLPAGKDAGATPAPPAAPPRAFANEGGPGGPAREDGPPIAGWHDRFYLRDRNDHFRLYPGVQLAFDLQSWFGPLVSGNARTAGGAGLPPRFVVRRGRIELGGELLSRWSFQAQFDTNIRGIGGTEGLAAGDVVPGTPAATIGNLFIDYNLCDCLRISFGQIRTPTGLENRTGDAVTVTTERTIATRGFIAPGERETGIMLWGDLFDDFVSYELMAAGGDGNNRPQVDGSFDFIGRVVVRPFSSSVEFLEKLQIGVSARHGHRDQYGVGYDAYTISTGQGLVLWSPIYTDSLDREIHVIPTGAQNQIGAELRAPLGPVDIRGELQYVANGMRESVDTFQLTPTNAERLGLMSGFGALGSVTWWALGDAHVTGDPGKLPPPSMNLKKKPDLRKGLALTGFVSAILADYDANSRGGDDDEQTPGSKGNPRTGLNVVQLGADASYWHTRHVRLAVDYSAYLTQGIEPDGGLVIVPGNAGGPENADRNLVHELTSRVQLWF